MTMFNAVLRMCNVGLPEKHRIKVTRNEETGFVALNDATREFGVFCNEREAQEALMIFLAGKTAGLVMSTSHLKQSHAESKTFLERLFGH